MKAIQDGRLQRSVTLNERNGRRLIELHAGKLEWDAMTDPSARVRGDSKAGGRPSSDGPTPSLFDPEEKQVREQRLTHAAASAERMQLDAELKRFDLELRRGSLVDRGEVQREAFRLARELRDTLQAIPDHVADVLAAEKDAAKVHATLSAEIATALSALDRREDDQ